MTPTVLDGPYGRVPINSLPSLEEFVQPDPELNRAQRLAGHLDKGEKTTSMAFLRSRLITNASNYTALSKDWYLRQPGQWETGIDLEERAIPVGIQVCAIGVWGDDGSKLCSPYKWRFARISMEPGVPEEVVARIGEEAHQLARVSLWCLGAAAVLLVVMPIMSVLSL
jgi:hypothetical protein